MQFIPDVVIHLFKSLLGTEFVRTNPVELSLYSCDGLRLHTAAPGCVVLPASTIDIVEIVKICRNYSIPFVARGAGTGLSGGAIIDGGVIIQLSRMNQILEIDIPNRCAVVQPGVVNAHLTQSVKPYGYQFAPDPSSQIASTIGGNLAENSGGPHTLKYGVTVNHILGQTIVLPNGELLNIGGKYRYSAEPDLNSIFTGSEGTIGIASEIIVNLEKNPEKTSTFLLGFDTIEKSTEFVSELLIMGVIPAAMEMIDELCIQAVEKKMKTGLPLNAKAVLLIELDGNSEEIGWEEKCVRKLQNKFSGSTLEEAETEEDRQRLWKGRKHAAGALGILSPAFYTNDGVVPRDKLTEIFKIIEKLSDQFNIQIANLCHAGDGNIHPLLLYNPDDKNDVERVFDCSSEILIACLELGGSLSGEHGIGVEKRHLFDKMFSNSAIELQKQIKLFYDENGLLNPGKMFPAQTGCGELNRFKTAELN